MFKRLFINSNKFLFKGKINSGLYNCKNFKYFSIKFEMAAYNYPTVRRDLSIVETHHGVEVADPYRWLEDPNSDETKQFVADQNELTNKFLETCKFRDQIRKRITELWNYEKYSCPVKRGDWYYFFKNTGLQNQSVLYRQRTLDSEAEEFLDPNKMAADGTVSLRSYDFSEDNKVFAYMISEKGSDWNKIKFKNVETGVDYTEVLENVKFSSMSWTFDNVGIFYNQFPNSVNADGTVVEKNEYQKVYYHRVGTAQSEDIMCVEFPNEPNWMGHAVVSNCGNYVTLSISQSCEPNNQLWYCDLRTLNMQIRPNLPFVKLVDNFTAKYEYVANEDAVFVFKTNLNAPNYKLIKIDLNNSSQSNWIDLLKEQPDVLQSVTCVDKNKLLVNYLHDCKDELYLYDLKSGQELYKFPLEIGTLLEISCKYDQNFFFYKFGSFTSPGDIYYCSLESKEGYKPSLQRRSQFNGLDLGEFKTEQVFYASKDGTKVPMFLVSKKNVVRDGNTPVYLYGYGGFNISLTPTFSVTRLIWLNHFNGIYACANLRGGGEYGESWYNAGRLLKKQNVFDDFISAGEYLISNNYTNKSKLLINGGSNGGLLVTATINQRPDLFQVAIADVAVCDMLRFHKFTIGSYWVSDYGCADNKEDFEYMMKYSPVHTIKENVEYPHVLLATADHDDRVVPSHSYKYMAELQHKNSKQKNTLFLRIDTKAGHGAGKPTSMIIDEYTDKLAYASELMHLEWHD